MNLLYSRRLKTNTQCVALEIVLCSNQHEVVNVNDLLRNYVERNWFEKLPILNCNIRFCRFQNQFVTINAQQNLSGTSYISILKRLENCVIILLLHKHFRSIFRPHLRSCDKIVVAYIRFTKLYLIIIFFVIGFQVTYKGRPILKRETYVQ